MDTAVGIFATRERAEEALLRLRQNHIPESRIVYLTASQSDAEALSSRMGQRETTDIAKLSRSIESGRLNPAAAPIFALGFGDKTPPPFSRPNPGDFAVPFNSGRFAAVMAGASSEETEFFQRVLHDGHSVVIVHTNSANSAATVCQIFDDLALSMKRSGSPHSSVTFRRVPGGALAEFTGRIALGDGTALLRECIQGFLHSGHRHILLDLQRVDYVDSTGLGELVRSHTTVKNHGGNLKLIRPSTGVLRLLQMTRLDDVFDIAQDESSAVRTLRTNV